MSRIYGFSASRITRAISASNAARHRKEVDRTIDENESLSRREQPEYSLLSVNLNEKTRIASVVFEENTPYRTIERYVTRNYVRYPVYSELKTKTKEIRKTVRLTNEELESLQSSEDPLVAEFAAEIITRIGNESLYPSWLWNDLIEEDYLAESQSNESEMSKEEDAFSDEVGRLKNQIEGDRSAIKDDESAIDVLSAKIERQKAILLKISHYTNSLFLDIVTLSIHFLLRCPQRRKRHERKILLLEGTTKKFGDKIVDLNSNIGFSEKEISRKEEEHAKFLREHEKKRKSIESERNRMLSNVKPLSSSPSGKDDFVPLRDFAGFERRKIVGCYVIRNKENGRCYIGQSKDVMKRLAQHFNGTVPKSAVFSEDYYSSKSPDKSGLFEIKILPLALATKDELDRTKKELIACYDSFNSGYNSTNGND